MFPILPEVPHIRRGDAPLPPAFQSYNDAGEPVVVKPMKYKHISRAVNAVMDAFTDDPAIKYTNDTSDSNRRFTDTIRRLHFRLYFMVYIKKGIVYTVEDGAATVTIGAPPNAPAPPESPSDRLVNRLWLIWRRVVRQLQSPEQRRRLEEVGFKLGQARADGIGDRISDMVTLGNLFTEPASQGKGYGSALVRFVNDYADSHSKAAWLVTSNVANTGFYESHGYITVADFVVGENNPTYDGKPILCGIMVREAPVKRD